MSFTINPDFGSILAQFNMIEVQGLNYIWGAILAFIIILIVSTEGYHMRVMLLPTTIILHMFGIYQHILLFLIAVAMFATAAVSFKVLKGGITAIAGGVITAKDVAEGAYRSVQFGSLGRGLTYMKHKDTLDKARDSVQFDKYAQTNISKLKPYEIQELGFTDKDVKYIDALNPVHEHKKLARADQELFNQTQLNIMRQKEALAAMSRDERREYGKMQALKRQHDKWMNEQRKEGYAETRKIQDRSQQKVMDEQANFWERVAAISNIHKGKEARKKAGEVGDEDLYDFMYNP